MGTLGEKKSSFDKVGLWGKKVGFESLCIKTDGN